jgi:hypothetical protein
MRYSTTYLSFSHELLLFFIVHFMVNTDAFDSCYFLRPKRHISIIITHIPTADPHTQHRTRRKAFQKFPLHKPAAEGKQQQSDIRLELETNPSADDLHGRCTFARRQVNEPSNTHRILE